MNDIKKVLIAAICVVLVVAIAAGVSIGVLAGTVNGLKDTVAELQQANEAQASLNASMKAEIEAAKNNEELVTAAEFEAKLAEALGAQTQTMQALITTAVKNQIEELGVEGLTEAQVQTIIDAAVENCLTEDDIDAIIADLDTGLTKDEVKKIVADYTAGTLTYGQIVNMIDDADYDLRAYLEGKMATMKKYLEDKIAGVQDGLTTEIEIYAEDAVNDVYTIDSALVANLVNAEYSIVTLCEDDDWSTITIVVDSDLTKTFQLSVETSVKKIVYGAKSVEVYVGLSGVVGTVVVETIGGTVDNYGVIDELIAEDCGNDDADDNTIAFNDGEITKYTDKADGYTVTLDGDNPRAWTAVYGTANYAFTDYGATVTISGKGAVADRMFDENSALVSVVIEEGITAIGNRSFRRCYNLTSVTLPESLETIDEAAFQTCTALTSIIIPEGVTSIGNQAFYGAGLTSIELPESLVTIAASGIRATNLNMITLPKSVTSIGQFAFRDSESLEYVYILCEDADAFTIAGDAFLNAATPYPDMTIFVANDAMKTKVTSSLTGYTDFITVKLIEQVDAAPGTFADVMKNVEDGAIVNLDAGTYTVPSVASGKTINIVGTKDTIVSIPNVNTAAGGSTLNFEGVTIKGQSSGNYAGLGNGTKANYTNCTFEGKITLYGTTTFTNCVFNNTTDYAVWTWGAGTAEFVGCTFNSGGKALLVLSNVLDNGTDHQTVIVNGCTFNDSGDLAKAAIEIGRDYANKTYDIIINNTTVNGFDVTEKKDAAFSGAGTNLGTNVWGNKNTLDQNDLNVVIDGVDVY